MNELKIQLKDINTNAIQHYEANEHVMMIFDTVGNETGDGGESDGEGDGMILLECIKNKSFEVMLQHDLTKADVDAYNEGAIPGVPKNWQPPQPP